MSSDKTMPQNGHDIGGTPYRGADNILTITRHDEKRVFADTPENIGRAHRPNADPRNSGTIINGPMQERPADVFTNSLEGRLLEHAFSRDHAEQFESESFEAFSGNLRDRFEFLGKHLVHDYSDDFDILLVKECLVDGRLIDRTPNAGRSD